MRRQTVYPILTLCIASSVALSGCNIASHIPGVTSKSNAKAGSEQHGRQTVQGKRTAAPSSQGKGAATADKQDSLAKNKSIHKSHRGNSLHVGEGTQETESYNANANANAEISSLSGETAPRPHNKLPKRVKAKGIYVSGWVAGNEEMLEKLIRLADRTDLNAFVIDVKNDFGNVTYQSNIPLVKQLRADADPPIHDIRGLLQKLKAKNIYTIGRIVTFKDPHLSRHQQQWAMRTKSGKLWRDSGKKTWADPYREEVWQYNIDIAKEAAAHGFDEIQFDYVRFPDNANKVDREVAYANEQQWTKAENVSQFLQKARKEINEAGAYVSADVFGLVTSAADDMGIGQIWGQIAQAVDYISPMTYPSHYSSGLYGISNPDLNPYQVIRQAMIDAKSKNEEIHEEDAYAVAILDEQANRRVAAIRPWLQNFTATWIKPHRRYGTAEVKEQIRALKDEGIEEFLLWSPNCKYTYE